MDNTWADKSAREGEIDEASMVEAARSDPAAFAELYMRYRGPIYRYLRSRAVNDEDAVDLTQQTFVRAFEAIGQYRNRGLPFGAWLFRIARNLSIDSHRRACPTTPWDLVPDRRVTMEANAPEMAALREESRSKLRNALDRMTVDQRELLALRFGSGLTMREIALIVGKTEGAVKKRVARTLESLRQHYDA